MVLNAKSFSFVLALSPLANIIGLNNQFPPEYMHLICLGIVKKLFKFYFSKIKDVVVPCCLTSHLKNQLNIDIIAFRKYVPKEFVRRLRTLNELPHYKATEFRNWLLYYGPVLLKGYLPKEYMDHFLHFIIYGYISQRGDSNVLRECVTQFVTKMPILFGRQSMTYNLHAFLHLPTFYERYGSIETFSSFPFENYLSHIKRKIRTTNGIFKHTTEEMLSFRNFYSNPTKKISIFLTNHLIIVQS